MRVLALELTAAVQRAAYHWSEAPATAPRLLIEAPRGSLAELRRTLERDYFGEPIRPGDFQIVTLADDQAEAVRAAFADFDVLRLDRALVEQNAYWLSDATPPDQRLALALAYWPSAPRTFARLRLWLHGTLAEDTPNNSAAAADLDAILETLCFGVAGRSARALTAAYLALTDTPIKPPVVPSQAILLKADEPLPHAVIDLRAPPQSDALGYLARLALVVASDPGIGQSDLTLIGEARRTWLIVIDTHADPRHFAAMLAYIREQVPHVPLITEPGAIRPTLYRGLTDEVRAALLGWLERWQPGAERIRRVIERFTL